MEPTFTWPQASTYIVEPPFLGEGPDSEGFALKGVRAIALLGDSVSTDHISPVSSITSDSPAGQYLQTQGTEPRQLHTYLARRGNHHVMVRGTFANPRLRNRLADRDGGWTMHLPSREVMPIYEAAQLYASEGTPLIVIAGREFGIGSSRDWAAKGMRLLGVRAVVAESFERIHRENLICLGILPLQISPGHTVASIAGTELFEVRPEGGGAIRPHMRVDLLAEADGSVTTIATTALIESEREVEVLAAGGMYRLAYRRALATAS